MELDATGRNTILLFKLQDMFRNNLNSVSVDIFGKSLEYIFKKVTIN